MHHRDKLHKRYIVMKFSRQTTIMIYGGLSIMEEKLQDLNEINVNM